MQATERHFTNRDVADLLAGVAARLQILEANRFRVIAFQNAAENIRNLARDVNAYYRENALEQIPGVGAGIAGALRELLGSGHSAEWDALFVQVPEGVVAMMDVPDMGPKKAKRLWEELGIDSVEALQAAAEAGKLRDLKGFGAKSEEKILRGIALLARRSDARTPIGVARPLALRLIAELRGALPAGAIGAIEVGGSLRRWKETIGDVDLLCQTTQPLEVMAAFRTLPEVAEVLGSGDTKTSVLLHTGLQVDLRAVEPKHWGAALCYFTGSKEHNVALREIALRKGWSLNEYGLTATGTGSEPEGTQRFFDDEQALYAFLGLAWVPPELREDRGEMAAARIFALPDLIAVRHLRGEFHSHTTWSDGACSVAEMAEAARHKGYEYWCVSDHSVGLGVVQGVDAERLQQQAAEIAEVNRRYAEAGIRFRVLQGTEVEILADGTLGLPDEVLARLDVVVASIHSAQRQDRETITERCLRVIRNPHVDILGHPTSRIIGSRPPTELDVERVLQECAATGTIVEVNANPQRLDLNDVYSRRAVEIGCKLVINCDAHSAEDLDLLDYGVATARRGWVTAADVVNTLPLEDALGWMKDRRKR